MVGVLLGIGAAYSVLTRGLKAHEQDKRQKNRRAETMIQYQAYLARTGEDISFRQFCDMKIAELDAAQVAIWDNRESR